MLSHLSSSLSHHTERSLGARHRRHALIRLAVATMAGMAITVSSATPSLAFDWRRMLFNGIQAVQLTNLSDRQDAQLGQNIHNQLVSSGEFRLSGNRNQQQYVNRIGQRLVPHSSRPDLPFRFHVVEDEALNAFATTGGFVYITTGTLAAADNEDQVAAVLAHEMAHITSRHVVKQMQQGLLAQAGAGAFGLDDSRLIGTAVEFTVRRPRSREAEYEADREGLLILQRAGYNPAAMAEFLSKLMRQSSPPEFFSTHPHTGDRVDRVNQAIDSNGWRRR